MSIGCSSSGHVVVGYGDPSSGRTIDPKFNVYFANSEVPHAFGDSSPSTAETLFQQFTDKQQCLAEGWLPIVITRWGTRNDVSYERMDYAVLPRATEPIDQSKLTGHELSVLISRLTVRNDSTTPKAVNYHIKPWKPEIGVRNPGGPNYPGTWFNYPGGRMPRSSDGNEWWSGIPSDVKNAWETLSSDDCVVVVEGNTQYAVCQVDMHERGRLETETSIGAVRYSLELNGGEEHTIHTIIPGRPLALNDVSSLKGLPYDQLHDATAQYWKSLLAEGMQVEVPDEHVQNLYNANLQHLLVTLTKDTKRGEYYPHVATLFYGVIGSESSPIIQAFDMRGMHHHAEQCLKAFLSTQGDAVPDGQYRSKEGGFYHYWPWYTANQGFVLWALAEHYFYSGDKDWLRKVAPQIVAGCEFIIRGRRLTMEELPGGRRPIYYGFAPAGSVADARPWKYSFVLSGFFYLGLKKSAQALEEVDPENARRISAEAADFLRAIKRGVKESTARSPVTRLRDNTSVPTVPPLVTSRGFITDIKDGADSDYRFPYGVDCTLGALQLVRCEVLGPNDPETTWLLNILEDRFFMFSLHQLARVQLDNISFDWFNLGGFDKLQPYYLDYPDAYLQRDQIPNFLRAFFNTLAAIADKQNLSFQEEIDYHGGGPQKTHEEAVFLHQVRNMLVEEMGQDLYLARGTPRSWLEDGKRIAVSRAPSYFGEVSFRIQSFANQGRIEASVTPPSRKPAAHIYLRLRHPKQATLKRVVVNGHPWNDFEPAKEWIRLPTDTYKTEVEAYY